MKLYNTFLLKKIHKKRTHMYYENDHKKGLVISRYWTMMAVIVYLTTLIRTSL